MLTQIEKYLNTKKGKSAYKKYSQLCEIKPQNLYVDDTDYEERYKQEHILLEKCIGYFVDIGYSFNNIIENIPEILEYYPYFEGIKMINSESNVEKIRFHEYLRGLNIEFYKKINPRKYGEYYTSLEMIEVALPEVSCEISNKVVDPSCGSGFILYAYVSKLLGEIDNKENKEAIVKLIQNNVYGFDVFPAAIITTKLLLGYAFVEKYGCLETVFKFSNIKVLNTLSTLKCCEKKKRTIPQFDLIIGNPPFFRVDPNGTDNVCKCTQYGHHYSHSLFLHWSLQYLEPNGMLCLILPESMLTGYYYQKVRTELLEKASICNIIINKEHEKMFDVQQDVMILIAQKGIKKDYYYTSSSDIYKKTIKRYKLPIVICENKSTVIPAIMSDDNVEILKNISKDEIVLELDEFNVSTGNYVWNQNKEKCYMKNGKKRKPLVSGPSIIDGKIVINHKRKNTYMYCEPDKPYYVLNSKAILFRRMSPMENKKRFIGAIINPDEIGSYVVENHVNIISGNEELLDKMYIFLNSEDFNEVLKMFCRTNQVSVSDINIIFEILKKFRKVDFNE